MVTKEDSLNYDGDVGTDSGVGFMIAAAMIRETELQGKYACLALSETSNVRGDGLCTTMPANQIIHQLGDRPDDNSV